MSDKAANYDILISMKEKLKQVFAVSKDDAAASFSKNNLPLAKTSSCSDIMITFAFFDIGTFISARRLRIPLIADKINCIFVSG